jgi:hypothetical protein
MSRSALEVSISVISFAVTAYVNSRTQEVHRELCPALNLLLAHDAASRHADRNTGAGLSIVVMLAS